MIIMPKGKERGGTNKPHRLRQTLLPFKAIPKPKAKPKPPPRPKRGRSHLEHAPNDEVIMPPADVSNTINTMRQQFSGGFDALEIAAGVGRNLVEFKNTFPKATIDVLDIDENYVDEMKRKYSGLVRDFYLGDAL